MKESHDKIISIHCQFTSEIGDDDLQPEYATDRHWEYLCMMFWSEECYEIMKKVIIGINIISYYVKKESDITKCKILLILGSVKRKKKLPGELWK